MARLANMQGVNMASTAAVALCSAECWPNSAHRFVCVHNLGKQALVCSGRLARSCVFAWDVREHAAVARRQAPVLAVPARNLQRCGHFVAQHCAGNPAAVTLRWRHLGGSKGLVYLVGSTLTEVGVCAGAIPGRQAFMFYPRNTGGSSCCLCCWLARESQQSFVD